MSSEFELTRRFEEIYRYHYPAVKEFITSLIRSREDAEDLAQDIFYRLWKRRAVWESGRECTGYVYTMARNAGLDFIRRQRVRAAREIEPVREGQWDRELFGDDPLDPIYYREAGLLLELATDCLPERRREIFRMSRFQGMENREIAKSLGLSVRTVEHHIHLSLRELRRIVFIVVLLHLI